MIETMDGASLEACKSYVAELRKRDVVPSAALCVFVAGSLVRGWGNEKSDVDLYIIAEELWTGRTSSLASVGLEPSIVPAYALYVDERKLDVAYWLNDQIDQLLAKVSWGNFDNSQNSADLLTDHEIEFLARLSHSRAVVGESWLERRRHEAENSAVRAFAVARNLNFTEVLIEDAVGQLQAGDAYSAVLSARAAFGHAVDALLSSYGEIGTSVKWRARRMMEVHQEILSFDDYWSLETMQTYNPLHSETWIRAIIRICKKISHQVNI
jgi:predicted nucleotidyltransferase